MDFGSRSLQRTKAYVSVARPRPPRIQATGAPRSQATGAPRSQATGAPRSQATGAPRSQGALHGEMHLNPTSASHGRVVGIDLGTKRIGVAVTDDLRMTVRPLAVIEARGPKADARALRALIADLAVVLIVVGLPLLPSGDEGDAAKRCREKGEDLARKLALPLAFVDESDTSLEAERILKERGRRRGTGPDSQVDALAAAVLLQSWLDDQGRLA